MPRNEIDLAGVLANAGSEEWNNCIASRLEVMRGYLAQEAWQKGISVYLRAKLGELLGTFLRKGGTKEYRDAGAADYLRGYAAAVEFLLSLPASVDGQIQREADKKKAGPPRGDAGY